MNTNGTADPALLPEQAAAIITRFNQLGMSGPTMSPDQLATALTGLIALLRATPNALRHISGHLLSSQRRGCLADIVGGDTDELAERIRQRVFDGVAPLAELARTLDEALVLVLRFYQLDDPGLAGAEDAIPLVPKSRTADSEIAVELITD
ncbi:MULTISPECIES: hypothetical protein [unclassified Kitasatospora]|uniref:hypothetical protein n=1 Tax=unclassified Kitasatospora TaxID=2633591 RepID=UPI0007105D76|nr:MULTISPECIES: hypothetical protein [unclassified Kitasatospora]KQV13475.1 hypothetical protein ASC99_33825 [Kitasatospora sp. Root107]KRB69787.1 hypothetical protein ASE03_26540 [Kitasatospora sp. Root187]